jgi:transcriptional regulator of acetoin/glycerol metabolism
MTLGALVLGDVNEGLWRDFAGHVQKHARSSSESAPPEISAPAIVAHWRRALALGASLEGPPPEENLLRGQALKEHIERTELVRHLAAADLERAASDVSPQQFVLLLADAAGVVVSTSGGGRFSDEARRVRLIPGASWGEAARGTNAIGTVIVEKRPVYVRGRAHLGRRFHDLVCYAAPIFDAEGTLVAVLDATSTLAHADDSIGLAIVRTADTIHQALRDRAFGQVGAALRHTLVRALERMQGVALLVEPPGRVTRMNAGARQLLGADAGATPAESLGIDMDQLAREARQPSGLRIERGGRRFDVRVDAIVTADERPIALLVFLEVVSPAPRSRPAPAGMARRGPTAPATFSAIFSCDQALDEALSLARRLAVSPLPVLLLAETGAGKELVARAIHDASPRRAEPFVAVNCGAIAPSLLESELFGYAPAAFTGAERGGRQGLFAAASGGTVFLDEVAEMTAAMQAALLRVLEDGTYRRVGEVAVQHADVRVVSATCKDLEVMVQEGTFRRDLFYRLAGARVTLPPLRARSDRSQLAAHVLARLAQQRGVVPAPRLSPEVLTAFQRHAWPGNVRELSTVLEVSLILAAGNPHIELEHLPPEFRRAASAAVIPDGPLETAVAAGAVDLAELESSAVRRVLRETDGNVSRAAKRLGVARSTLYRMMRRYAI